MEGWGGKRGQTFVILQVESSFTLCVFADRDRRLKLLHPPIICSGGETAFYVLLSVYTQILQQKFVFLEMLSLTGNSCGMQTFTD